MTSTMQGVFFLGPKQLELREVPIPEPGPGEVIVRVGAATTCGTDLKGYLRGHRLFRPPMPFGHEFAGTIAAVGAGVTRWREGDRIAAANSAPCNQCFYCKRGRQQLCVEIEDRMNFGAYAEYIRVPAHIVAQNLYPLPADTPFEVASFTEPLACAVLCILNANITLNDTVAIIGVGAQGLMQIQLARHMGAARVIAIGRSHSRLPAATEVGADVVFSSQDEDPVARVKALTDGHGADVTIEAAGNPVTWQQAMMMTRKGGTVMQFSGLPGGTEVAFDATHLHYGEITMKGVFHHNPRTVEMAVGLLASGGVNVRPMLDGAIPLADVEAGLLRMQRSEVIKLAVMPELQR